MTRFQIAVRENVTEEKQNQLRWQVRLGDAVATFEQQAKVLEDRITDWKLYKVTGLAQTAFQICLQFTFNFLF